jgi:hypothetical protein
MAVRRMTRSFVMSFMFSFIVFIETDFLPLPPPKEDKRIKVQTGKIVYKTDRGHGLHYTASILTIIFPMPLRIFTFTISGAPRHLCQRRTGNRVSPSPCPLRLEPQFSGR